MKLRGRHESRAGSGEADKITPAVTLDHMREPTCVRQGGNTPLFGAKELFVADLNSTDTAGLQDESWLEIETRHAVALDALSL